MPTAKQNEGLPEVSEKDPKKGKKTPDSTIAIGLNYGAKGG